MVDAHCHLNFHVFEKDLDTVVKDAVDAGVTTIVTVGAMLESSRKAVEIAQKYEQVFASVGIHPHHADKLDGGWLGDLERLIKQEKVIAVGEIGLDYYSYRSNGIVDPDTQKEVLISQLELAAKYNLPLQIHNRHAEDDLIDVFINYKSLLKENPGMIHCFSGSLGFLKKTLELGFYIGFDGNITYAGKAQGEATDLKELVKYAPLDRIITETDSPYLTPVPFRNLRNEPKHVIIVAEFIAKAKDEDLDTVFNSVEENFNKVFGKNT
jgi:TatD DNase family protein